MIEKKKALNAKLMSGFTVFIKHTKIRLLNYSFWDHTIHIRKQSNNNKTDLSQIKCISDLQQERRK